MSSLGTTLSNLINRVVCDDRTNERNWERLASVGEDASPQLGLVSADGVQEDDDDRPFVQVQRVDNLDGDNPKVDLVDVWFPADDIALVDVDPGDVIIFMPTYPDDEYVCISGYSPGRQRYGVTQDTWRQAGGAHSYDYVIVHECTDLAGSDEGDTEIEVYLPTTSNAIDPNVSSGVVITYTKNPNGEYISGPGYEDACIGTINIIGTSGVPDGWAFCDGNNGTPNLNLPGRVLIGGSTTGDTAGTSWSHSHGISSDTVSDNDDDHAGHTHDGSDDHDDHKHVIDDHVDHAHEVEDRTGTFNPTSGVTVGKDGCTGGAKDTGCVESLALDHIFATSGGDPDTYVLAAGGGGAALEHSSVPASDALAHSGHTHGLPGTDSGAPSPATLEIAFKMRIGPV